MAIGAQNLYIIEQGLAKNRIFLVCFLAFLADCFVIAFGVYGVVALVFKSDIFVILLGVCGALFLLYYGLNSLASAFTGTHFAKISKPKASSLKLTISKTLALSLLNPHAYVDAFVIIGGFCATLEANLEKTYFYLGAISASFVWFFLLGYGSMMLSRFFTSAMLWRILDLIVAAIMFYIAYLLLFFIFEKYGVKFVSNLL